MRTVDATLLHHNALNVKRCATSHQAALQLSFDTTIRKFHHTLTSHPWKQSATTCSVARRSKWLLGTPPTTSGVSPQLGRQRLRGFSVSDATLDHADSLQATILRPLPQESLLPAQLPGLHPAYAGLGCLHLTPGCPKGIPESLCQIIFPPSLNLPISSILGFGREHSRLIANGAVGENNAGTCVDDLQFANDLSPNRYQSKYGFSDPPYPPVRTIRHSLGTNWVQEKWDTDRGKSDITSMGWSPSKMRHCMCSMCYMIS